jgi:hypothetical protein
MVGHDGYRVQRISRARLALSAGQEVARRRHLMFGLVEADLTEPLRLIDEHRDRCGERLSLSGYIAICLARTLSEFPDVNAFRRGRSLVLLDEVTVVVLLERTIDGQSGVGYLPIHHADTKSLVEVTREIRAEQAAAPRVVRGQRWLERVPVPLVPVIMRWATRNVGWALQFGTAGVNNVGFGELPGWGLAPGAGTLAVTIGGITRCSLPDGTERRTARLTIALDHDVVDGAPAARFTSRLLHHLASGEAARLPLTSGAG